VAVADSDLDALYRAPFDEFISRRNALEKRLRKQGDNAQAISVKAGQADTARLDGEPAGALRAEALCCAG
jgi:hypothetical protein